MSYLEVNSGGVVEHQGANIKAKFIQKTYLHLIGAIILFALLESLFFSIGLQEKALQLISIHKFAWLGVIILYGFISYKMDQWARQPISRLQQYIALFIGVLAFALVSLPLLAVAEYYSPGLIYNAAIVTAVLVAALTAVVFITGKDFSFLKSALSIGSIVAIGLIVAGIVFNFSLGIFFSGAMIIFASAAILYETSKINHYYKPDQYVGASLSLFASVGLLFWYVIQFMMQFAQD